MNIVADLKAQKEIIDPLIDYINKVIDFAGEQRKGKDYEAVKWAYDLLSIHDGVKSNPNSQYWLERLKIVVDNQRPKLQVGDTVWAVVESGYGSTDTGWYKTFYTKEATVADLIHAPTDVRIEWKYKNDWRFIHRDKLFLNEETAKREAQRLQEMK